MEQAFGHAAKVDGCRWVLVSNERSHAQPCSALGRNYLATVPSRASLELLCVTGPLARVSDARS